MREEFCSCCGKLGFGPMVQEDHDDFFCYSCVWNHHSPYPATASPLELSLV